MRIRCSFAAALVAWAGALAIAQPTATDLGNLNSGSSTTVTPIPLVATQVVWYTFTLDVAATDPIFLDIDTHGSAIADTEIGLYSSTGALIASDDDDGNGNHSQLTFGPTDCPVRPPSGTSSAYNGRDGTLAAGLYYLALGAFNTTFNATNWSVTSASTTVGNATLNINMGTQGSFAPPVATDLGALVLGDNLSEPVVALGAGEIRWYSFTVPAAVSGEAFLDIDTEGSVLTDLEIAVYGAAGQLEDTDDNDGDLNQAQLTYGSACPVRSAIGAGLAYNGRDGALPAGTYYLAIAGFNATFTTCFTGSTTFAGSGDATLNIRYDTAPLSPPTATDLGTLTLGNTINQTVTGLSAGEVRWYTFVVPALVSGEDFLDIDTEGSAIADVEIALYRADGGVEDQDDNDGSGNLSQLTYGSACPLRAAVGTGLAYNGRDGTLAAGTYYLAIAGFNATYSGCFNGTTTFAASGDSSLNIRYGTAAPTPPTTIALGDIDPGDTLNLTPTLAAGEIVWYEFSVDESVASPLYLDVDTEGSTLAPANDTELGLYRADGTLVTTDDDDGSGTLSQLSYGAAFPARPPVGVPLSVAYNGRDGNLPAGTYYLALAGFNSTFGTTCWGVTSPSTNTGNAAVNITFQTIPPPPPDTWREDTEAGETLATVQVVEGGSGALNVIQGNFNSTGDADIYQIEVCDSATFSATTVGQTTIDTQLFLFRTDGTGLAHNDDAVSGVLQSTLTNAFVPGNGTYLLAVVHYNRDPFDAGNALIWANTPFVGERAPDGPGAANAVDHWTGTGTTGGYAVALTGACWPAPAFQRADTNCDSAIDFFDIDPFLLALFDAAAYDVMFPDCDVLSADTNCDDGVDFFDIDPFLDCLFNGCGPCP